MAWLPVSVTTGPASEPVTTDDVKAQTRIDGTAEDSLLSDYITRARETVEDWTGTKLGAQTVEFRGDDFTTRLPVAPVISITSVRYLDEDGVEQTLSTDVFEAVTIGLEPELRLKVDQDWPTIRAVSDAVRVVAVSGYSEVPGKLKQAILLIVSHWYEAREMGGVPEGAWLLMRDFRRLQ